MGEISTKDILYMINKILISDCPITCDDLKVANDIFGTRIKALKIKTLWKSGKRFQLDINKISAGFLDRCKNVTLTSDIILVNKIRTFITISSHIQFGTA